MTPATREQRSAATGRLDLAAPVEIALILGIALVVRAPFWAFSVLDWDESAFILAAREMLRGHLPYTTFIDNKPPGSTALIAGAMLVLGERVVAARVLAFACVAATALLLRPIVRELGGGRIAAFLAAILYIAFSTRLGGLAAHTEVLLAPFTAAGVLLLLREGRRAAPAASPRASRLLAAGLLLGIAVWIKYVPGAPAVLVAGVVLLGALSRRRIGPARAAGLGLAFASGLAAPALATLAVYWASGLLDAFLYWNFGFARTYVGAAPGLKVLLQRATAALLELWPLLLLGAIQAGLALRRRGAAPDPWTLAALLGWLAGEAVAVTAPRQFFGHYFLMLLPPLSAMSALAIEAGARRLAAPGEAGRTALLAGAFAALVPLVPHALDAVKIVSTREDFPRMLAARMRPEIRPGETIYAATWAPILHLLTDTPLSTPYAFPEYLVGSQRALTLIPSQAELERILAARPRFIVLDEAWKGEFDPRARAAIEAAIAARYRLHTRYDTPDGSVKVRTHVLAD